MRILAILPLTLAAVCWAQSDQSQVESVLKQRERAEQTGDFNSWLALWTPDKAAGFEQLRSVARSQPNVHYRATNTYVQGDRAVILVEGGLNSFATMMLRKEAGQWKIADEKFRDTAAPPNSVYALVPPELGGFAREGSRWDLIAPGLNPTQVARQGWQMKAVFDGSYLYIRIETNATLPAPGSTITTPPGGWPVLKIDTNSAGEFILYDAVNVGDQATFDSTGRANSHRAFAAYMIRLEHDKKEVFSASADMEPSPLLQVAGRDYDIRIPLATMGIMDSRTTTITVGDAQWPKSAILSIAVQRYPR